jgi:hypothetical protein
VSRLESGRQRPKPAVVQAWVSACPVPILPVDALVSAILTLDDSDRLGVLLQLSAPITHPAWAPSALHALQLPAPDVADETVAPAYLWLSWVAGRHWGLNEADQVAAAVEQLASDLQGDEALESVFGPLWERLSAIPPVARGNAELPDNHIFRKLAALWPRIRPELRGGVLRVAEELARVKM